MTRSGTVAALATVLGVCAPALAAQEAERAPVPELSVRVELPGDGFLDAQAPLELTLNRPLDAPDERIAVFVGATDYTGLFRVAGTTATYRPRILPLPAGENDLVVYRVDTEGAWTEIARQPLRVEGRLGYRSREVRPRVDLSLDAQLDEGRTPEEGFEPTTYQNVEGSLALGLEQLHSGFELGLDASFVGVNHQANALRFRDRGEDAPKVDLSSYRVGFRSELAEVEVGHVRAGRNRYLMNGFSARGATVALTPGDRVDARVGVTNGSSIVGWDDLIGLNDGDHRLVSTSLGFEALPNPGGLRVELSWMDGSILPRSGFNQGQVNDAETSTGLGVTVSGQALDRRLRYEAGFARSTFDNPEDPTLSQGLDLVPVEEESRNARFVDASLDVLRNVSLGGGRSARLSVGYAHERVDPLYRSVGTSVRADQQENRLDVRADVAGVGVQLGFADSRDNLDEIASILTSNTDRRSVDLNVPFPSIVRGESGRWLPTLRYRLDRTHQFGEGLPENGGFSESHVPDQLSTSHTASVAWRFGSVDLGYQVDFSDQDNRQEGREDADFKGRVDAFSVGLTPHRSLTLGVDLSFEEAEALARDEVESTRRWGLRGSWRPLSGSTLSVSFSDTFQEDGEATRERGNSTWNLRWSSTVPGAGGIDGQYFFRWSRNASDRFDRIQDVTDESSRWNLNAGLSFGLGGR